MGFVATLYQPLDKMEDVASSGHHYFEVQQRYFKSASKIRALIFKALALLATLKS
jgi:hypothetical protein